MLVGVTRLRVYRGVPSVGACVGRWQKKNVLFCSTTSYLHPPKDFFRNFRRKPALFTFPRANHLCQETTEHNFQRQKTFLPGFLGLHWARGELKPSIPGRAFFWRALDNCNRFHILAYSKITH